MLQPFKPENLFYQLLSSINLGAKEARNNRGVTTDPPKKNLVPRFGARIRRGENTITFRKPESTRILHDLEC